MVSLGLTLFMVLAIGMWLRDRRLTRTARRTAETVQVLGNIYYAIYRVNAKTGAYEITKGSDFVMQNLEGDSGDYTNLLRVITSGLDEWTGEEFSNSFSLENIRRLVDQQVQDFGGEFLRQTGEAEPRWISIRLLTDPERIPNEAVLCFRDVEEEKEQQQQVRLLKALWPPRNRAKSLHGNQTLRSGTDPGN